VFFESDFLSEAAELTACGLRDGRLRRREEDGVVIYPTGREDFDEFPLVRADDLPTQHMRALAYWMAAPGLEGMTSIQVCGAEWVSHVICRRQLMDELIAPGTGQHPRHDIFHGMVSRQKRAVASSEEGALLIDDLTEWLEAQIDATPHLAAAIGSSRSSERVAAQVALGYFLPRPVAPRIDFEPAKLLHGSDSPGWDLVRARSRPGELAGAGPSPAQDPDYRFAVVQSELHRRHLRLAVERLDIGPLARYVTHLARWYLEDDRSGYVERVVHTLLDRGACGLGVEGAP
jgi:hypothetical protein